MAKPLREYRSLQEFFSRPLRDGVRTVSRIGVASPVDGRVMVCDEVAGEGIERVKGLTYSLRRFLGLSNDPLMSPDPDTESASGAQDNIRDRLLFSRAVLPKSATDALQDIEPSSAKGSKGKERRIAQHWAEDRARLLEHDDGSTSLFYIVLYLAPGDYHRIHHPVNWSVTSRTHFAGQLYPVQPTFMTRLRGLLSINERVVLSGKWKHGFFSLTAVGATNVGSIYVNFDKELRTNKRGLVPGYRKERVYEPASVHIITPQIGVDSPQESTEDGFEQDAMGASGEPADTLPELEVHSHTEDDRPMSPKARERLVRKAGKARSDAIYEPVYEAQAGAQLGGFSFGSTVVLIFEAPADFQFSVTPGQKVAMGQLLGQSTDDFASALEDALRDSE